MGTKTVIITLLLKVQSSQPCILLRRMNSYNLNFVDRYGWLVWGNSALSVWKRLISFVSSWSLNLFMWPLVDWQRMVFWWVCSSYNNKHCHPLLVIDLMVLTLKWCINGPSSPPILLQKHVKQISLFHSFLLHKGNFGFCKQIKKNWAITLLHG